MTDAFAFVSSHEHRQRIETSFDKVPATEMETRLNDVVSDAIESSHPQLDWQTNFGMVLEICVRKATQPAPKPTIQAQTKTKTTAPGTSLASGPKH